MKYKINMNSIIERNLENKTHKEKLFNIKNSPGKLSLSINNKNFKKLKNWRINNFINTKKNFKKREINDLNTNNNKLAKKLKTIKVNNVKTLKVNNEENKYINLKKIIHNNNKIIRIKKNTNIIKENKIIFKNIKNIKNKIDNNKINKFYKKFKKFKISLLKYKRDRKGNLTYLNNINCTNGNFLLKTFIN